MTNSSRLAQERVRIGQNGTDLYCVEKDAECPLRSGLLGRVDHHTSRRAKLLDKQQFFLRLNIHEGIIVERETVLLYGILLFMLRLLNNVVDAFGDIRKGLITV